MYQQQYPSMIIDSHMQFRLRIDGFLRSIGLYQIIGTKEYLEIDLVGGECSVRVLYPNNVEELHGSIKRKLLTGPKEIDNIRFYINDHIEEIGEVRNGLAH